MRFNNLVAFLGPLFVVLNELHDQGEIRSHGPRLDVIEDALMHFAASRNRHRKSRRGVRHVGRRWRIK
jgi:hypothetical protein